MIINSANLAAIRTGFNTSFRRGLGQATSQYAQIATIVPSSTKETRYGWLGKMPNMRNWIGERNVQGLSEHDYSIVNEDFELTIGVDRNDIKDDNLGVYDPMFVEMGESVAAHPDLLTFKALSEGFTRPCYDGQNFFDTDHPVLDADGEVTTVSNTGGGSGPAWFLMSTQRALKPLIFQDREKPVFTAMDDPKDPRVFMNKEFIYGTDARYAVGFGFWQMAFGSRQPLNAETYAAARTALQGMKGDYGRPLGIMPNLLVVSPAMEQEALELLNAERNAAGATNIWRSTATMMMSPWLA